MGTAKDIIKQKSTADIPGDPAVRGMLATEFLRFVDFHDAKRLSKNLRSLLLEFLMHDGALQAVYVKELLYDLNGLFLLLDAIQAHHRSAQV